jgi:hypothetical protein
MDCLVVRTGGMEGEDGGDHHGRQRSASRAAPAFSIPKSARLVEDEEKLVSPRTDNP